MEKTNHNLKSPVERTSLYLNALPTEATRQVPSFLFSPQDENRPDFRNIVVQLTDDDGL
jgi:hypothetical protein